MSKPSATKSWATGRPKLAMPVAVKPAEAPEAPEAGEVPETAASPAAALARPVSAPASGLAAAADRAGAIAAEWAPTAGRILLGVVFVWFGYHELVQPDGWTQYVPFVSESSSVAVLLVLTHGWVLLMTGAALVAGIAPRAAAALATVLMLEIVTAVAVTGQSPTALRDVGVLGLAVCLTGVRHQHLVLRN
jgi:uncharacterized membrane protein YphA (DoxX/SURF4 family)